MNRVRLSELSEPVRAFLERVRGGESIIVEDDQGQLQCGITPYAEASEQEKQRAMAAMEQLWQHTAKSMAEQGITEEDIDRVLQEDD
jgi:antitoxin (DNA-binding transcriptional repressor) of toxin-antitoxin stability system